MNIRNAVKHYLQVTGTKQGDLARRIGISPSALSFYLNKPAGITSIAEKLAPIVYSVPQTTAATGQAQPHD